MKKRITLRKLGIVFAVLFAFIATQSAYSATAWNGGGDGETWSDASNWDNGVPDADDAVTINAAGTVILDVSTEIESLTLSGTSVIEPDSDAEYTLTVSGDITFTAVGDGIKAYGTGGNGRLNIVIDGTSTITLVVDADGSVGLNFNDLTILDETIEIDYDADTDKIICIGDLTVTGESSVTNTANGIFQFLGGYNSTQNVSISDDSFVEFYEIQTDDEASVIWNGDFYVTNEIQAVDEDDEFICNSGTLYYTNGTDAPATMISNANSADIQLYDVVINASGANEVVPTHSFTVKGDFTKFGDADFAPTAGTITFDNAGGAGKDLSIAGGAADVFFNLAVADGSRINTSSDISIAGDGGNSLNILGTGIFIATDGEITFTDSQGDGGAADITVSSTGLLEFNDLTAAATATELETASDFTVKGNFTIDGSGTFRATSGTITFDNSSQKTVVNTDDDAADLIFYAVNVAENSSVLFDDDHTINNDLTLMANAELDVTDNKETDFNSSTTIIVDATATLTFEDVVIGAAGTVNVNDESSFTVDDDVFTVTAGGTFEATDGTVTFTNAATLSNSAAIANLIFYNLVVSNVTLTLTADDYMTINGDLTINGASGNFVATTPTGAFGMVAFSGSSNQTIDGTSTAATPISIPRFTMNKTTAGGDTLFLEHDFENEDNGEAVFTLTDGVLHLGSKTLTLGQGTVSRNTGLINGATGTLLIAGTETQMNGLMSNTIFTIDDEPSLYNLTINVDANVTAALDGTLTVNGTLTVGALFSIEGQNLIIKGNITQTALGDEITFSDPATSILTLDGSGSVSNFSNTLFNDNVLGTVDGGSNLAPSITIYRADTLDGDLTFDNLAVLTIDNSVNTFDIGSNTLSFDQAGAGAGTADWARTSGQIDASAGAVVLNTSQTTLPENIFDDNIVEDLTIFANLTLSSDLTINGDLTYGAFDIDTDGHVLTLGPNSQIAPDFTEANHVIGTVKRTVTNSATVFPVGGGAATSYRPLAITYETAGSSIDVTVKAVTENAAANRDGDPESAINVYWDIETEGTLQNDNLTIDFGWDDDFNNNGLDEITIEPTPAVWQSNQWTGFADDYSLSPGDANATTNFVAENEIASTASTFPISDDKLQGIWTVFVNDEPEEALAVADYKLAFTNFEPNPPVAGTPFTVTVQLQDKFGNPVNVPSDATVSVDIDNLNATTGLAGPVIGNVIAVGENSKDIELTIAAAEPDIQIKAYTASTIDGDAIIAGASEMFNVIDADPSAQASAIDLTPSTSSITINSITSSDECVIVVRADSAITDYPVDGTSYTENTVFGKGSSIGDGVVVYNGAGGAISTTVTGLSPLTTYYFRAFLYTGTEGTGTENYITFKAAGNPIFATTTGTYDDDEQYGENDTRATAKEISVNTPIRGTIKDTNDVDWFSFTVPSSRPNIRASLELSTELGNYNIELYNSENRRIRRGTRLSNQNEAQVINDLPAGTYSIKISGVDNVYDATNPYVLKIKTSSGEILSITD